MLGIFKKKVQKYYMLETDSTVGRIVFEQIGRKISTSHAEYHNDLSGIGHINFVSNWSRERILNNLKETFGDVYDVNDNGGCIVMTLKGGGT